MPTLKENVQKLRDMGLDNAQIRAAMSKAFGVDAKELAPYVDRDVREIKTALSVRTALPFVPPQALKPTEMVEGVPVPMVPTARDVAATSEERQVATEMEAVPMPEEAGPAPSMATAEQLAAVPDTRFVRKGGLLTGPIETAEFVGGAVKGLGEKVATSLLPYVPGVPGAARLAALKSGEETLRTMEATREELAKTRKQRMEDGFVSSMAQDIAITVGGLANLVGTALIGTLVEEPDPKKPVDLVKAGEALGRALPAAVATQAIEAVRNPIETAQTAPFTTALTLVPLAMTAANAARGTAASAKAIETLKQVVNTKVPFAGPMWNQYKQKMTPLYRFTIDAMETGSPEANVLLDELITTGKRIEAEFGKEAPTVVRGFDEPTRTIIPTERFGKRQVRGKEGPVRDVGLSQTPTLSEESIVLTENIGQKAFSELDALRRAPGNRLGNVSDDQLLVLIREAAEQKVRETGVAGTKAEKQIVASVVDNVKHKLKVGRQGQLLDEEFSNFVRLRSPDVAERGITTNNNGLEITAQALIDSAAANKPLPNFIRTSQPTGQLDTVALVEKLNELKTRQNVAAVESAIAHVNRLSPVVDYGRTGISGLVNPAIKGYLEGSKTFVKGGDLDWVLNPLRTLLTDIPKKVALPLNVKAMTNNILGNEVLTSLAYGELPFANALRSVVRGGKGALKRLSPEQQEYLNSARRAGLFEANVIEADIKATDAMNNILSSVAKPVDKVADFMGKGMQIGDDVYRVSGGFKEWKKAKDIATSLTEGQYMQVPVSPNISIKLTKLMDGRIRVDSISKGKVAGKTSFIRPQDLAGERKINDILARYAKHQMDAYYFDYGRVPQFITLLRKAPGVGAGSPFYTWGFKALDIPGIKPGLMSAVLKSPTNIITNNAAANAKMMTDAALLGIKRAALIAATRDEATSDPELARVMSYDPKNPSTLAFKSLGNPAQVGVARYSSANFLEPTLSLLDLASGMMDNFSESDLEKMKAADPQGAEFALLMKRLQQEATQRRDPVATALKLAGLGGGIMMDVYGRAVDSEEQGKRFDMSDYLKVYVPGPVRAFVFGEGAEERFRQVEPGMKPAEDALDWHIRNVIGLGYQTVNTQDQYQRFKRGVQKEMEAIVGKWKVKRQAQLAERMGANEALAKAEDEAEKLKDIVTLSIEDMDAYFEKKFGIETQARK